MYLYSLQVENYRAVRRATLSFDQTTVLIGENDSGKSSLLEVLARVLDAAAEGTAPTFLPHHFHHRSGEDLPAGPIRIRLGFRERQAGEWSGQAYQPLSHLLPSAAKQPREVTLELSAEPRGGEQSATLWRFYSRESRSESSDPRMLQWLRRANPAIRLSAGMLTGHGIEHVPPLDRTPDLPGLPQEIGHLVGRIESSAHSLLSGQSTDTAADLNIGFTAARELVGYVTRQDRARELGLARKIGEILGREFIPDGSHQTARQREYGSNAERLGVLLLIAALLRVSPGGLVSDMEPIWIIEDPEAHLHPMTLTSVTLLIGHIKWQKIITTYSGELIASLPLRQIRRLIRHQGIVYERRIAEHTLSREELRRIHYHLRARHGAASFARLWLFVEGETEFWIVPQLARLLGYEFALEGICCIEFAQSGLKPLIKAANGLGVEWHLLADGDDAGQAYLETARRLMTETEKKRRLTLLSEPDIEHCLWENGYADLYREHSHVSHSALNHMKPSQIIQKAVKYRSKPYLALSAIEAIAEPGSPGIPGILRGLVERCISLARQGPANIARRKPSGAAGEE